MFTIAHPPCSLKSSENRLVWQGENSERSSYCCSLPKRAIDAVLNQSSSSEEEPNLLLALPELLKCKRKNAEVVINESRS